MPFLDLCADEGIQRTTFKCTDLSYRAQRRVYNRHPAAFLLETV